jgi:hypothetical protein
LSGIEKLNQEAPKNGDKEEAEDADEDVEELGDGYTLRLGLQDAANDCERDRHEAVNEGEKNAPPDFCHDGPIKWHDRQRCDPGGKPKVGDAITAEDRAERFPYRSHCEIAAEHAKEEEERGDDRRKFMPLDEGKRRDYPTYQR